MSATTDRTAFSTPIAQSTPLRRNELSTSRKAGFSPTESTFSTKSESFRTVELVMEWIVVIKSLFCLRIGSSHILGQSANCSTFSRVVPQRKCLARNELPPHIEDCALRFRLCHVQVCRSTCF